MGRLIGSLEFDAPSRVDGRHSVYARGQMTCPVGPVDVQRLAEAIPAGRALELGQRSSGAGGMLTRRISVFQAYARRSQAPRSAESVGPAKLPWCRN